MIDHSMNESQYSHALIPTGLPGGFFLYEAGEGERIVFADANVISLYGCSDFQDFLDYVGGCFPGMVYEEDQHKIHNEITAQTMFGEKRHDYVRYRIRTKQGVIRYIEDFGHLLHGGEGKSYFYVFIVDVDQDEYLNRTKNSFAEAQILSMNQDTDALTGLFNMSFFYQKVQVFLASPESRRKGVAFIHFDIPNFKLYNERYGFRQGDELLFTVAAKLRDIFSAGTVARFSDDHFIICIAVSDRKEVTDKVEQAIHQILMAEDPAMGVRIKAGIYYLDDRMPEVGLACDHARLACNSIKNRHDFSYCVYDENLREKLRKQQYVADHIDEAVEKGYVKVFYQPVIRVKTGEVCGFEALVRWIDPVMGFLSPGDFIETLEQFHLIHKLDGFVVKQVCADYKALKEKGEDIVPVSINLSRLDFELCNMFELIETTRQEYDVPASMLDIEITESALNDSAGIIKKESEQFRQAGYHIWIDDFGSGYSSLNMLTDFSFDVLKLDLMFLRSYDSNPKSGGTLLSYIIGMAAALGTSPLTEGVESEEHFKFLKGVDCERAQGYYFSKPLPMAEVRQVLLDKGMHYERQSAA